MARYKVTLKQGNKTMVADYEAKSLNDLVMFLDKVSTCKVSCIQEVVFEDNKKNVPIDDFNYFKQYKAHTSNENSRISRQVIVHNVKKTINQNEMADLIIQHLEVNGQKIDGVVCSLFME